MKRALGFFLALIMLLSATSSFAEASTIWKVKEYVDEFDEPTGEKYIVGGPFYGKFSNSATTDAELSAYVFYDGDRVWIQLYEYDDLLATNPFSQSQEYFVGVKADLWDISTGEYSYRHVFRCRGNIPSNGNALYIVSDVNSDFYSDNYEVNYGGVEVNFTKYNTFDDVLGRSQKIIFSIKQEGGMNEYIFTVNNASGFSELSESVFEKEYIEVLPDVNSEYGVSVGSTIIHKTNGEGEIIDIYNTEAYNSATDEMESYTFATIKFTNGTEDTFALKIAIDSGSITVVE